MKTSKKRKNNSLYNKKVRKLGRNRIENIYDISEVLEQSNLLYDVENDQSDSSFSEDEKSFKFNIIVKEKKEKTSFKKKNVMIIDDEENDQESIETITDYLPCREKEQNDIYNYIKTGLITTGSYSSLYISGMPGTGKTACVKSVINKLRYESENNKIIPKFNTIYVNGMKLTTQNTVFKMIYREIFTEGKQINHHKCTIVLDNFFKNRKYDSRININYLSKPHLVLVVDEIDCLMNKKQNVLYNLFNWTTYSNSRLIVISISNTLDLPEKLSPKIASRIGNKRLIFKPYQTDELIKILNVKVNAGLFSDDALRICSMKVASVNGDIRRIFQICKRAEEIFESEIKTKKSKIEITHIQRACSELFDSKIVNFIRSLKFYEKIVLLSILFQMKINMNNKINLVDIYDKSKFFCLKISKNKEVSLNFEEFRMIIYNLNKLKIILLSDASNENFLSNNVSIKFYVDEFISALCDDDKFKLLIQEHLTK